MCSSTLWGMELYEMINFLWMCSPTLWGLELKRNTSVFFVLHKNLWQAMYAWNGCISMTCSCECYAWDAKAFGVCFRMFLFHFNLDHYFTFFQFLWSQWSTPFGTLQSFSFCHFCLFFHQILFQFSSAVFSTPTSSLVV